MCTPPSAGVFSVGESLAPRLQVSGSAAMRPYHSGIEFSISTASVPAGIRGICEISSDESYLFFSVVFSDCQCADSKPWAPPVVAILVVHGKTHRETDSCGSFIQTELLAHRSNTAIFLWGYFIYDTDTAHLTHVCWISSVHGLRVTTATVYCQAPLCTTPI
jgi:hypothetical protein